MGLIADNSPIHWYLTASQGIVILQMMIPNFTLGLHEQGPKNE